jgi:hypothetical protein
VNVFASPNMMAQRVYRYNAPGNDCYSELIFEEKAVNPKGVIVLDTKGLNITEYSQTNPLANSALFQNYNFLYINVLNKGSSSLEGCYEVVMKTISDVHHIYLSSFFVINTGNQSETLSIKKAGEANSTYNTISCNASGIIQLVKAMDDVTQFQTYRIPVFIKGNLDEERESKMRNYKRNLDIGIYLSPTFLTDSKLGLSKNAVTLCGLSVAKNFGHQFTIKANFGISFKKPDQSSIQSGIQSKMMAGVKNGDSTIIIDQSLSGHILLGGDVSLKYYFVKTKLFRPYFSAGAGLYNLTNISGRIQDTLDISGIDLSNPSSMQSGIGSGISPESGGLKNLQTRYFVPQVELGFEYRLAPAAKLNVSVPLRYFSDKSSTNSSSLTFGFNLGLAFTLNPAKFPKKQKKTRTL